MGLATLLNRVKALEEKRPARQQITIKGGWYSGAADDLRPTTAVRLIVEEIQLVRGYRN